MPHKETVDAYMKVYNSNKSKGKPNVYLTSDGENFYWYPNIPDKIKAKERREFKLDPSEEILFVYNIPSSKVVITNIGLHYIEYSTNKYIDWKDIEEVEFSDNFLLFHFYEGNRPTRLFLSQFTKQKNDRYGAAAGKIYAELFTRMANSPSYNELIEEGKEDEAMQILLNRRNKRKTPALTPMIADLYFKKGQQSKAIRLLEEDIKNARNPMEATKLYYKKYLLQKEMGEFAEARKACSYVINQAPKEAMLGGVSILEVAREDFVKIEEDVVLHFFEIPYIQRKLIVTMESYSDLTQKKLMPIDINNMPAIQFPMGPPIVNQLYVGHPYTPSMYIPFDNYKLVLLEDKLREFCYLMQALGATEITIESLNSTDSNKYAHENSKMSAGFGYKAISASASYESDKKRTFLETIKNNFQLHQIYQPHNSPKLPEKLVWYEHEPSWQRIFEQRREGRLLEHEERIETMKSHVVDNSELSDISAELKSLIASVHGHWTQSIASKFETQEDVILSIHVKFAPLESLQGNAPANAPAQITQQGNLTETEKDYLGEVKSCLEEDGEITDRARRLLNRIREKSGITEERAAELEATLQTPQLAEEEKEYLDEYKACLEESEDGTLSPRERRLLNKIRASQNITEERAAELEKM